MGNSVRLRGFSNLLLSEKIKKKEGFSIIRLYNYEEVKYLLSKGVKFGDGGISATSSRHSGHTYRLCETKRNMNLLDKYRKSITLKV